jgi:hypothetical protein
VNGITVSGECVARDQAGNMHLKVHGWFGAQALSRRMPGLGFEVNGSQGYGGFDDRGRTYVAIFNGMLGSEDTIGAYNNVFVTPLEPARSDEPPHKITIVKRAAIFRYQREGMSGRTVDLASGHVSITMPVPQTTSDIGYDVPERGAMFGGTPPDLTFDADFARAQYYEVGGPNGPVGTHRNYDRAIYWYRQANAEATQRHNARFATICRQNMVMCQKLQREQQIQQPLRDAWRAAFHPGKRVDYKRVIAGYREAIVRAHHAHDEAMAKSLQRQLDNYNQFLKASRERSKRAAIPAGR